MKKALAAAVISLMMAGCGAAVSQPAPADSEVIKTLQMQQQSSSERIAKLEKELSDMKENLDRSQRQSKILGENYDAVLKMFNDYKTLVTNMITTMNKAFKPQDETPSKDKKTQ